MNLANNAHIYKVLNNVRLINMDVLEIKNLKTDLAYSSPAWGGISFNK